MTTSRFLPILNLCGCLLITGIVVAQWLKERGLNARAHQLQQELVATRDLYQAEKSRVAALENDVRQLKQSVAATVDARKAAEETATSLVAERDAQAAGRAAAHREQLKVWEDSVAMRDAKLRDLQEELVATRRRLDEAVSRLKAARPE